MSKPYNLLPIMFIRNNLYVVMSVTICTIIFNCSTNFANNETNSEKSVSTVPPNPFEVARQEVKLELKEWGLGTDENDKTIVVDQELYNKRCQEEKEKLESQRTRYTREQNSNKDYRLGTLSFNSWEDTVKSIICLTLATLIVFACPWLVTNPWRPKTRDKK